MCDHLTRNMKYNMKRKMGKIQGMTGDKGQYRRQRVEGK